MNSKKRATAVVEEVDLDEQERRRKRAERFGNPVVVRFSKLNCPLFTQTSYRVLRLDISRNSVLAVFTNVLLPLWILCTIMIGGAMRRALPVAYLCCSARAELILP